MIGKRDSFEKEKKPVEVLTKKQRRNKHCKQNYEWLLEESEETKKKKAGINQKMKEKSGGSTTKFVLKREGLGISFFGNLKKSKPAGRGILKQTSFAKAEARGPAREGRKISLKKTGTGQINFSRQAQLAATQPRESQSTSKKKEPKPIPKMVWNSRGQCDEVTKLKSKINKVRTYWNRTSLLIPNVFRHVCELEPNSTMLFEYLDLSRKELLVQANGQKAISQAGAPHLQRKNKITKKTLEICKEQKTPNPKMEPESSQKVGGDLEEAKEEDSGSNKNSFSIERDEGVVKKEAEKKEAAESEQEEVRQSTQTSSEASEHRLGGEDDCGLKVKLEKIKKQLREDMNKVHQRIEKSFISEKKQNWSKLDLQAFNRNISEYNQLLDEQDKLKVFQQEKPRVPEAEGPASLLDESTLRRLEQKYSQKDSDRIKEQVSLFIQRKGLEGQARAGGAPGEGQLTLQDILKMELQISTHKKPEISALSKMSRRIQKKRAEPPRKKNSLCGDLPSSRKRAFSKKASFFSTQEQRAEDANEVQILFGCKEEDLVVSVNQDSLEGMSTGSLSSLGYFAPPPKGLGPERKLLLH